MTKVERTKKAIFEKYPDAVIDYEYSWGEVLFYANEEQSHCENEEKLHSGQFINGVLIDVTDF